MGTRRVLLLEPFFGGSHKQLIMFIENLLGSNNVDYDLVTLPAKKWHWRARTSALYMAKNIPNDKTYDVLFCSSVLNLAELIALRDDLRNVHKIIYFHENQFVYPQQCQQSRDFQYGYNTILSAMVADVVIFNSNYNKNSFLDNITKHLRKQPDFMIKGIDDEIKPKCSVLYFPVVVEPSLKTTKSNDVLHIVWPHRWEHDKNPELFFETLFKLKDTGANFKVSVLGEEYVDPMPIFKEAQEKLAENIVNFGRLDSREDYLETLLNAHVVVSTAIHEFFGVAILEAVKCGCCPIVPNALVYPEMYPSEYLYSTHQQLFKKLRNFCLRPQLAQKQLDELPIQLGQFEVSKINSEFIRLFNINLR